MAQVEYTVRMERPDRKRAIIRRLFNDKPFQAASSLQLAGFLTHKLFADSERGGEDTHYTVTIRFGSLVRVFTVRRLADGRYTYSVGGLVL